MSDLDLIRDTAAKLLQRNPRQWDATWRAFVEHGLSSLATATAEGTVAALAAISEECGRAGCAMPLPAAVLAQRLLAARNWHEWVQRIAEGTCLPTVVIGDDVTIKGDTVSGRLTSVEHG